MNEMVQGRAESLEAAGIQTVAIVGLGLLGGSLGRCLRERAPQLEIIAYARREDSVRQALALEAIDRGSTDPAEILPAADLTVLCIPVAAIVDFAREHAGQWRTDAIVTDVGSVKKEIVSALVPALSEHGAIFVGSHPMAGSEQSGLDHSDPALYEDATVLVTPGGSHSTRALETVTALWELSGAAVFDIAPDAHDALLARTSHLPHLLAAVAVRTALQDPQAYRATGGGFRDFTRIAAASPDMWGQIFQLNREHLLAAIDKYSEELNALREKINDGQWQSVTEYLDAARNERLDWQNKRGPKCE